MISGPLPARLAVSMSPAACLIFPFALHLSRLLSQSALPLGTRAHATSKFYSGQHLFLLNLTSAFYIDFGLRIIGTLVVLGGAEENVRPWEA